jgi:multiple sugar transport system substrate-binding protein
VATSTAAGSATTTAAAQSANAATTTLTWGGWADTVQLVIFNDIIAAYQQANPSVKINGQFAPWDDYWQKVQTQLASNTAPDVIEMSVAYIGNFVAKGVVLNLDSYVASRKMDLTRYWPVDVSTWRFAPGSKVGGQGSLYAMSYDASINSTFFYNKTLFDKAKLPYPDATWNWDKVLDAAKELNAPSTGQWGMLAPYIADGAWTAAVWEWGGDTISADYTKGTLSQPPALAALTTIYDYVYTYKVSPPPDLSAKVPPFSTGKIGMYFSNCDCDIATFKKITSFEWDVAHWPAGPKGHFVEMEPDGHAIVKATKQPEAAFDFLKYVIYDPNGGPPHQATYGTLPAIESLAKSNAYLKQPGFPSGKVLQLQDILNGARSNYFGQGWAEWEDQSDKALQQAWLGKKSIQEAAKDADAAIDNVLQHLSGSLF